MTKQEAFNDFVVRFKLLITKNPALIKTTLSNIFTMRLIGSKTHGDLAEIGISEFINQLQLSTDKNSAMFPYLKSFKKNTIDDTKMLKTIFSSKEFSEFGNINVLPLIYDEKNKKRSTVF